MDNVSNMEEEPSDLNQRIAARIRELRAAQGLSLDALAGKCGVSRSMISLIERGESSPTAVLLEKLAAGLGVLLSSLFEMPPALAGAAGSAAGPVARRDDQPLWRDPASGYLRRSVSPAGSPQPLRIVEVIFPPGARVAFENEGRGSGVHQQVWVLEGTIDVSLGDECFRLREGDALAMPFDRPTMFHNPAQTHARYAVVIASVPATGPTTMSHGSSGVPRRLLAIEDGHVEQLADVLMDCVEGDASVSFMHPLTRERALAFWRDVARGVAAGERALLVAEDERGLCGTVQLIFNLPENQPHRADLAKMLVHRRARRRGLGAGLMRAAEDLARECGKTLLVLDAVTGGDAARLYERLGWVRVGDIPNYALMPRGGFCSTTFYYRDLRA
jgi:transcriptional regulator with XRE-family HTH domain/GNAT superfamily N-acetyltransferase